MLVAHCTMDYDSAGCLNLDSKIKREFLPVTLKALLFSEGEGRYIQGTDTRFKPLIIIEKRSYLTSRAKKCKT